MRKLDKFPADRLLLNNRELAGDYFVLVLLQMGELWRRFVHNHDGFPYKWFELCHFSDSHGLCSRLVELQAEAAACDTCVDVEFSGALLSYLPSPLDLSNPQHQQKAMDVQRFLQSVAIFSPISTDQVEALHGYCQSKLHRFRGLKPTDAVASEITLWAKVTSAFAVVRKYIWDRCGDVQALRRLAAYKRFGPKDRGGPRGGRLSWQHLRAMAANPDNEKLKRRKLSGNLSGRCQC